MILPVVTHENAIVCSAAMGSLMLAWLFLRNKNISRIYKALILAAAYAAGGIGAKTNLFRTYLVIIAFQIYYEVMRFRKLNRHIQ